MAILAPGLSIGGLTALLCAIIVMLIPLAIWVFCSREADARKSRQEGALPEHDPEKREPIVREDHAEPVQGVGHMQTPFASRPASKAPLNPNLYGGRLSIARVVVSIALVLITLVIAFAQNGSWFARNSAAPTACALRMPQP